MKSIGWPAVFALALITVSGAVTVSAAGPIISGFHPSQLYVWDPKGAAFKNITIAGSDLVAENTSGRTFDSDVRVLVRHSGGSFSPARVTEWSDTQLDVEVNFSSGIATSPGALEFQVIVR